LVLSHPLMHTFICGILITEIHLRLTYCNSDRPRKTIPDAFPAAVPLSAAPCWKRGKRTISSSSVYGHFSTIKCSCQEKCARISLSGKMWYDFPKEESFAEGVAGI
jgi:hypothetical protein